jgi:choline dehydrogenase
VTRVHHDFIVVGGGSAGCLAAARLVRDHGARVLLIERGPAKTHWLMRAPAGYLKFLARDDYLEMHKTVASPSLNGRALVVPQARVLGGGSAVNAMVYMRGQHEDYDDWDRLLGGNSGWSFEDMLPHFRRMERNARLNDRFHGIDGPLDVDDPGQLCRTTRDFILAAQGRGFRYNADFNGARQDGVGVMQHTMGRATGRLQRADVVRAFIAPLRDDPRLTVRTGATATRIVFDGRRAIGVEYVVDGATVIAHADAEVLLAAGTYNSAKLLMFSGIGPRGHLREHGIDVVSDLEGVGMNLQDHHEVPVIATTHGRRGGYFGEDRGWRMLRNGLQYLLFGSGAVTTTGIEACLFHDPDGGSRPSIQLYCVPTIYIDRDVEGVKATHGVTLNSCLLRPRTRGTVRLRSPAPLAPPLVACNFLEHPDDLRLTLAAMRVAREILATAPLASRIEAEWLPGADKVDDKDLAPYCARMVKTNYHPVGTAAMGPDDDGMAVLDARLRVRGVSRLRVIDASAMPRIPSGNTNAPTLALADRAVAFITGEATPATHTALAPPPPPTGT